MSGEEQEGRHEVSFADLGLAEGVMEGLSIMGYARPTPIQRDGIPIILSGKDLIGCAQTGTGKTAAFLLPILSILSQSPKPNRGTRCLIITPTRELALQIDQQVEGFSYYMPITSMAIYGGNDGRKWGEQRDAVRAGADILVATPGRLLQFVELGVAQLESIEILVLDEADQMLDMGFIPDIRRIIGLLTNRRQTLLFSATMPKEIRKLATDFLTSPAEITLEVSRPAERVEQRKLLIRESEKLTFLKQYFSGAGADVESCLIFVERKTDVRKVAHSLARGKLSVDAINSDLEQAERQSVLEKFKARQVRILVATNILSRGIDIEDVELVINYNVPSSNDSYVHRVGRTARAARSGRALTLASKLETYRLGEIERFLGNPIPSFETDLVAGTREWIEGEEIKMPERRGRRGGSRNPMTQRASPPKKEGEGGASRKHRGPHRHRGSRKPGRESPASPKE